LNTTSRSALESAAGLCLSRTNYNVEIEHWLARLLDEPNTDLAAILHHYGVDHSRLVSDVTRQIDRFKTGNARPPALAPNIVDLAREGWLIASVECGAPQTRSGHLLVALLTDEALSRGAREISDEFEKIEPTVLLRDLASLTGDTVEAAGENAATAAAG